MVDLAQALGVDLRELRRLEASQPGGHKKPRQRKGLRFLPHGAISDATVRDLADRLNKTYQLETWRKAGVLEGTVGREPAIAFSLPTGGYKVVLHRRPDRRRGKPYSWRFADGGKPFLLMVGEGDEVLLTAGEWDLLAALNAGFPCVATGTAGEGTWRAEWSKVLQRYRVVIIYDVDEEGVVGAKKAAAALRGIAVDVRIVKLPLSGRNDMDGNDLSDYLQQYSRESLQELITVTPPMEESPEPLSKNGTRDPLAAIIVNRQIRDVIADAWKVVRSRNRPQPQVFMREGHLVRLTQNNGLTIIQVIEEQLLFGILVRGADWVRVYWSSDS